MGFSRHEYWSGLPCTSPGHVPNPGIEPTSHTPLALAAGLFTTSAAWEHLNYSLLVQSPSGVQLFAAPWTAARQASLNLQNRYVFHFEHAEVQQILELVQGWVGELDIQLCLLASPHWTLFGLPTGCVPRTSASLVLSQFPIWPFRASLGTEPLLNPVQSD